MRPAPLDDVTLSECQREFFDSLRSGQLLEPLFDAIPGTFYFIKNAESRFMGASLSFAQTLGESSVEALLGKSDYDYSPDFLADAFYADDQRVLSTGEPMFDKIELVPAADGSLDWLCTSKIPLFNQLGAVFGLAGIARVIRDSDSVYALHPEMQSIVDFVRAHYREKLSISDMAKEGGISVSTQERLFRKLFGLTPLMYLQKTRLNAACAMLRDTDVDLARIAHDCGFNDQTSMTRVFRLELKITPLKYRRRFSEAKLTRRSAEAKTILFPKV